MKNGWIFLSGPDVHTCGSLNAVFLLRFKEIYEEAQRVSPSRAPQLSEEHTPEDHGLLCQHQVLIPLQYTPDTTQPLLI